MAAMRICVFFQIVQNLFTHMKKTFLFRTYPVTTRISSFTGLTPDRKGSVMTIRTLVFLKNFYANETRQVWIFDESDTCVWKNQVDQPLQSEADCQQLLKTLTANTGSQLFWYHSLLYTAELQQNTDLECWIVIVTPEPVLTNIMNDQNFRTICQDFLADQREAVFQISTVAEQIYDEVESNNIGDLEQEAIFSNLNDVMRACCRLLRRTNYYTELEKYSESESTILQPVELSRLLFDFAQNCKETLGRRVSLKIQAETKIWVLSNEARLCFSLLCLLTQLLSHEPTESTQTVFLQVVPEKNMAALSIQVEKTGHASAETEPPVFPNEAVKRDYDLTNAVLRNFCKTYNAQLEPIVTDQKQGLQLKIPLYPAHSNLHLHAEIPRRRRAAFLNNYQVMLYDIADYRFY